MDALLRRPGRLFLLQQIGQRASRSFTSSRISGATRSNRQRRGTRLTAARREREPTDARPQDEQHRPAPMGSGAMVPQWGGKYAPERARRPHASRFGPTNMTSRGNTNASRSTSPAKRRRPPRSHAVVCGRGHQRLPRRPKPPIRRRGLLQRPARPNTWWDDTKREAPLTSHQDHRWLTAPSAEPRTMPASSGLAAPRRNDGPLGNTDEKPLAGQPRR